MTFAPAIPVGGIAGLALLDRTAERQFELFGRNPELRRDIEAFETRAGQITTVDDLMADRQVLRVVLGAYGLDEDLDRRAFVRKIIEEGSLDPEAFANRIADPAYREMAAELGFGDLGGRLVLSDVRERLVDRFQVRQFEQAVGEQDVDLRLALTFRREIARIAESEAVETSGWLRALGSRPLRRVIEAGFGLPTQFVALDLDQQVAELESVARRQYGAESPVVFADRANVEDMVRRFLVRSQIERGFGAAGGASSGAGTSTAVAILQAGGLGSGAQAGLFASQFG